MKALFFTSGVIARWPSKTLRTPARGVVYSALPKSAMWWHRHEHTDGSNRQIIKIHDHVPGRMKPSTNKTLVLALLALTSASLCIALPLLWHFSNVLSGFAVSSANHYLLVYGPTAILTLFISVWRQVDYHCKSSTPWEELQRMSAKAERSVLVDYISTLQITALWSAISHKHIQVVSTIVGFVLLKLTALASTGLLAVEDTTQLGQANVNRTSAFTGTVFNASAFQTLFDQASAYAAYSVMTEAVGPAFGISNGRAYETFSAPPELMGTNITMPVNVFQPSLDCLPAQIKATLTSNSSDEHPPIPLEIVSPACALQGSGSLFGLNPANYSCPPRQLSGLSQPINCQPSVFNAESGAYMLLTMLDMRYQQTINTNASAGGQLDVTNWSMEVANLTGIVCRLSYSMGKANLTTTSANPIRNVTLSTTQISDTPKLQNFTDSNFLSLIEQAFGAVPDMFGDALDDAYAFEYPDSATKMMAKAANGSYESLLDAKTMYSTASTVYSYLGAQIAASHLIQNVSTPQTALTSMSERRLFVSTLSTWLMFGFLCIFLVAVLIMLARELNRGPPAKRPKTLLDFAGTAHNSLQLQELLRITQQENESDLKQLLQEHCFFSESPNPSTIVLNADTSHPPTALLKPQLKGFGAERWWIPLTMTRAVYVIMVLLPVLGILTLELLQMSSDKHQGIIALRNVENFGEVACSRYLPALIALTIATLFNSLEFNALLLSPYDRLTTGVFLKGLTQRKIVGQFPLTAMFRCAQHRMTGPFLSSMAAIIGSFLTSVVSGLYQSQTFPVQDSWSIKRTDLFIPTWTQSVSDDSGAAVLSSLVENLNASFPVGTFDELAYPSIQASNMSALHVVGDNASITVELPVLRANLNCEVLDTTSYNLSSSSTSFQNSVTVEATYVLPAICPYGGPNGTDSFLNFEETFNFGVANDSTYIGKLLDIHVGPFNAIQSSSSGELAYPMADNPIGCPSIALIYGYVNANDTSQAAQNSVAVQVCYQNLRTGTAKTTLSGSSLQIDAEFPPVVNESSFSNITVSNTTANGQTYSSTALQYRIQRHFDQAFSVFNSSTNPFSLQNGGTDPPVDPFFQGVLFGRTPIPLDALSLSSNAQSETLRTGIQAFYRRYMAQAISLNMRNTDNSGQTIGTGLDEIIAVGLAAQAYTTRRLVQDNTSKIVLQSMLGFMVVCGVGTLLTTKMRNVLPIGCNPCTIWGQMSLWVGSEVAGQLAREAEVMHQQFPKYGDTSVTEISESPSPKVKLGWWYTDGGARWYGIDSVRSD